MARFLILLRSPAMAVCALSLLACGGTTESARRPKPHPVLAVAPFDLDCPVDQLRLTVLNKKNVGVTGCGRRARYHLICRDRARKDVLLKVELYVECEWAVQSGGASPDPATVDASAPSPPSAPGTTP
jgi:hypothetical protein